MKRHTSRAERLQKCRSNHLYDQHVLTGCEGAQVCDKDESFARFCAARRRASIRTERVVRDRSAGGKNASMSLHTWPEVGHRGGEVASWPGHGWKGVTTNDNAGRGSCPRLFLRLLSPARYRLGEGPYGPCTSNLMRAF